MTSSHTSKQPNAQGEVVYTAVEHDTWAHLIKRQDSVVKHRACEAFLEGLNHLNFPQDRIPQCDEVSDALMHHTGWQVTSVNAVISADDFFTLLASKQFPATQFIRRPEHMDYIKEPDVFHAFYGQCPLLTHPPYAHFVEAYGKLALQQPKKERLLLFRLFWFTIEFGLLQTENKLSIYGAGILSSFSETQSALTKQVVHRPFSALNILRTPYRIDIKQPIYYALDHLNTLDDLLKPMILDTVRQAIKLGDFTPHEQLDQHKGGLDGNFAC